MDSRCYRIAVLETFELLSLATTEDMASSRFSDAVVRFLLIEAKFANTSLISYSAYLERVYHPHDDPAIGIATKLESEETVSTKRRVMVDLRKNWTKFSRDDALIRTAWRHMRSSAVAAKRTKKSDEETDESTSNEETDEETDKSTSNGETDIRPPCILVANSVEPLQHWPPIRSSENAPPTVLTGVRPSKRTLDSWCCIPTHKRHGSLFHGRRIIDFTYKPWPSFAAAKTLHVWLNMNPVDFYDKILPVLLCRLPLLSAYDRSLCSIMNEEESGGFGSRGYHPTGYKRHESHGPETVLSNERLDIECRCVSVNEYRAYLTHSVIRVILRRLMHDLQHRPEQLMHRLLPRERAEYIFERLMTHGFVCTALPFSFFATVQTVERCCRSLTRQLTENVRSAQTNPRLPTDPMSAFVSYKSYESTDPYRSATSLTARCVRFDPHNFDVEQMIHEAMRHMCAIRQIDYIFETPAFLATIDITAPQDVRRIRDMAFSHEDRIDVPRHLQRHQERNQQQYQQRDQQLSQQRHQQQPQQRHQQRHQQQEQQQRPPPASLVHQVTKACLVQHGLYSVLLMFTEMAMPNSVKLNICAYLYDTVQHFLRPQLWDFVIFREARGRIVLSRDENELIRTNRFISPDEIARAAWSNSSLAVDAAQERSRVALSYATNGKLSIERVNDLMSSYDDRRNFALLAALSSTSDERIESFPPLYATNLYLFNTSHYILRLVNVLWARGTEIRDPSDRKYSRHGYKFRFEHGGRVVLNDRCRTEEDEAGGEEAENEAGGEEAENEASDEETEREADEETEETEGTEETEETSDSTSGNENNENDENDDEEVTDDSVACGNDANTNVPMRKRKIVSPPNRPRAKIEAAASPSRCKRRRKASRPILHRAAAALPEFLHEKHSWLWLRESNAADFIVWFNIVRNRLRRLSILDTDVSRVQYHHPRFSMPYRLTLHTRRALALNFWHNAHNTVNYVVLTYARLRKFPREAHSLFLYLDRWSWWYSSTESMNRTYEYTTGVRGRRLQRRNAISSNFARQRAYGIEYGRGPRSDPWTLALAALFVSRTTLWRAIVRFMQVAIGELEMLRLTGRCPSYLPTHGFSILYDRSNETTRRLEYYAPWLKVQRLRAIEHTHTTVDAANREPITDATVTSRRRPRFGREDEFSDDSNEDEEEIDGDEVERNNDFIVVLPSCSKNTITRRGSTTFETAVPLWTWKTFVRLTKRYGDSAALRVFDCVLALQDVPMDHWLFSSASKRFCCEKYGTEWQTRIRELVAERDVALKDLAIATGDDNFAKRTHRFGIAPVLRRLDRYATTTDVADTTLKTEACGKYFSRVFRLVISTVLTFQHDLCTNCYPS